MDLKPRSLHSDHVVKICRIIIGAINNRRLWQQTSCLNQRTTTMPHVHTTDIMDNSNACSVRWRTKQSQVHLATIIQQ